jgi:hypothetical protein
MAAAPKNKFRMNFPSSSRSRAMRERVARSNGPWLVNDRFTKAFKPAGRRDVKQQSHAFAVSGANRRQGGLDFAV